MISDGRAMNFKTITLAMSVLLIVGCAGPRALRSSYVQYAESFAGANNQQLLLNLARLREGHPPFFLQLGAVTAQFKFDGGLSASHGDSDSNIGASVITNNLGLNLGGTESPTFSFTPLRGEGFSNILLRRIGLDVLYNLADQELPLAVLMRVMVQEITLAFPDIDRQYSFYNDYDSYSPENYADFLRLVAGLTVLQRTHQIALEQRSGAADKKRVALAVDMAADRDRLLGTEKSGAQYSLLALRDLPANPGRPVLYLKPRTFFGMLMGAAYEEVNFDAMDEGYLAALPLSVRRPLLRITAASELTEPAAAQVEYAGKQYLVSDRPGQMYNRFAFLVLQFLASQTELDPGKLPAQQLIQVR